MIDLMQFSLKFDAEAVSSPGPVFNVHNNTTARINVAVNISVNHRHAETLYFLRLQLDIYFGFNLILCQCCAYSLGKLKSQNTHGR